MVRTWLGGCALTVSLYCLTLLSGQVAGAAFWNWTSSLGAFTFCFGISIFCLQGRQREGKKKTDRRNMTSFCRESVCWDGRAVRYVQLAWHSLKWYLGLDRILITYHARLHQWQRWRCISGGRSPAESLSSRHKEVSCCVSPCHSCCVPSSCWSFLFCLLLFGAADVRRDHNSPIKHVHIVGYVLFADYVRDFIGYVPFTRLFASFFLFFCGRGSTIVWLIC